MISFMFVNYNWMLNSRVHSLFVNYTLLVRFQLNVVIPGGGPCLSNCNLIVQIKFHDDFMFVIYNGILNSIFSW